MLDEPALAFLPSGEIPSGEMADAEQCVICQGVLKDGTDEQFLTCGHSFHSACLTHYSDVLQLNLEWLKCPICKKSSRDIQEIENQLGSVPATQVQPPCQSDANGHEFHETPRDSNS